MRISPLYSMHKRSMIPPNPVSTCLPITNKSLGIIEISFSSQYSNRSSRSSYDLMISFNVSLSMIPHTFTSCGIVSSNSYDVPISFNFLYTKLVRISLRFGVISELFLLFNLCILKLSKEFFISSLSLT